MNSGILTQASRAVRDPRIRIVIDQPSRVTLRYLGGRVDDIADLIELAIRLEGPRMFADWRENGPALDGAALTGEEARLAEAGVAMALEDEGSIRVVTFSYGSPFTTILEFSGESIAAKAIVELVTRLATRAKMAAETARWRRREYKRLRRALALARRERQDLREPRPLSVAELANIAFETSRAPEAGRTAHDEADDQIRTLEKLLQDRPAPLPTATAAAAELLANLDTGDAPRRLTSRLHRTVKLSIVGVVVQLDTETTRETSITWE